MIDGMENNEGEPLMADADAQHAVPDADSGIEQHLRIGGVELRTSPDTGRPELHADGGVIEIDTVRRLAGAAMPQLSPQHEENWSTEHEAHALGLMVNEGLPAPIMQRVLDWYADAVIVSGLDSRTGEDAFRQEFKNVLSAAQQDRLLRWYRESVEGEK